MKKLNSLLSGLALVGILGVGIPLAKANNAVPISDLKLVSEKGDAAVARSYYEHRRHEEHRRHHHHHHYYYYNQHAEGMPGYPSPKM